MGWLALTVGPVPSRHLLVLCGTEGYHPILTMKNQRWEGKVVAASHILLGVITYAGVCGGHCCLFK